MKRSMLLLALAGGCVPDVFVVPASDSTPPSAMWLQGQVPDLALANVFLDGQDAVYEVAADDVVALSASADDPDGGVQRLEIWASVTLFADGVIAGPTLPGAPEAAFASGAGVGEEAERSVLVSSSLDVGALFLPSYDRIDVDVWAEAENFHGGASTTPVLTVRAAR